MVAGSIGKVGATYSIDVRIIDIQSGRIVESYARDYRGEIDGLLSEMTSIANLLVGIEGNTAVSSAQAETTGVVTKQPEGSEGFRAIGKFNADQALARQARDIKVGDEIFAYRKDIQQLDKGPVQQVHKTARRLVVEFDDGNKSIEHKDAIAAHSALQQIFTSTELARGDKIIVYYRGFKRARVVNVTPTGEVTVQLIFGKAGSVAMRPVVVTADRIIIWAQD